MKKFIRKSIAGAIMVETAFLMPIFLFMFFSFFELGRAMYVSNMLSIAAQRVAKDIAINEAGIPSFMVANFSNYATDVRYTAAVLDNSQFTFDIVDSSNATTVSSGAGDFATSSKIVVTVSFPPAANPELAIPAVDPGYIFGSPLFGTGGLPIMVTATAFLERSRRPIINPTYP